MRFLMQSGKARLAISQFCVDSSLTATIALSSAVTLPTPDRYGRWRTPPGLRITSDSQ